jgi:5S rRNA maturation endonuclease (ribonuclease M5)
MLIPHNPERLLDLLRQQSVIVEGKKDKKALNFLGIDDVVDISGKPLDVFIKKLDKQKRYVILTDFDDEGERKNKELCKFLQKHKFKLNLKMRPVVKTSFGIVKIEELIKFSKIKEDDYHGKIGTINNKIFNRSRFYRKWCSRETRRDWCNIWAN